MMISDRIEVACSGEWLRLVFSMASMESTESTMRISVSFSVAMSFFIRMSSVYGVECAARVCAELIQPMVRGGEVTGLGIREAIVVSFAPQSAVPLRVQASSTLDSWWMGLHCVIGFLHLAE